MNTFLKFSLTVLLILVCHVASAQNALDFDGVNDKVDCGNDTSLQISGKLLTIEAWIYPTVWGKNVYDNNIVNKEDNSSNYGYMFRCGAGGELNMGFGDGSWNEVTSTNAVLSLNTWQHVAGTYDGVKMRLYVNGKPVDSFATTASITNASTTNLLLGANLTYGRYFQGMMDEVRIWNIALDSAAINANMNRELCVRPKNLKLYYKFNQGKASSNNPSVKKVNDLSLYRNHGTVTNFALSGSSSNWLKGQNYLKDAVYKNDTISACARWVSPSKRYTWIKSGVYNDTLPTVVMGCDSIITTNLTIRKVSSNQFKAFACSAFLSPSGLYTWTKSGVYTDFLKNHVNCDSILTITLTVGTRRDSIYPKVCKSYTLNSGKRTLFSSGTYVDTLKSYRACDSLVDVFLTIYKETSSNINLNVCQQWTAPSGKRVFKNSGVYSDTIKNYLGCDSVITINLKILNSSSTITANACNKYTSPSGKYTWTISGSYKDTIKNVFKCDSFINFNLTIKKSTTGHSIASACSLYVHPRTKKRFAKSGIYSDTLLNYMGCDSIHIMSLTIDNVDATVSQNGAVLSANTNTGSYQWLNCSNYATIGAATNKVYTATVNGNYAVEVTNATCKDTSICYTISGLSIENLKSNLNFGIYPNPNSGKFEIQAGEIQGQVELRVYDLKGKVIMQNLYSNFIKETLILNLENGLYILEAKTSNGIWKTILNVQ
jgi:hypothetical protein